MWEIERAFKEIDAKNERIHDMRERNNMSESVTKCKR